MRRPFVVILAVAGCGAPAAPPTRTELPARTIATPTSAPASASAAPPPKDSDGDKIADADDKCPFEPETYNGIDDDDGCPDKLKVVVVTTNPPVVERVRFPKGSSKPVPEALAIIDAVAAVMKSHPEIELVQLEGHAEKGEPNALKLSEARAEAVKSAVVARGIDGKRLRAKGFAAHCPINLGADYDRRVDFKVVTMNSKPSGVVLGCAAATAAGVVSDP